jgi:Lon-like ATP-dependent protease
MKLEEYFGSDKETIEGEEWDWKVFKSTKDYPIAKKLLSWVIGQDNVLKEVYLCLDEWLYKLKYLQKAKWYMPWLEAENEKPLISKTLTPGPYLLLLGEPGTGKSLIGKAMADYLNDLYKQHKIKRFDVLCWDNRILPNNPRISIHPAGQGKDIIQVKTKIQSRKSFFQRWGTKALMGFLGGFGTLLLSIAIMNIMNNLRFGLSNAIIRNEVLMPLSIGGSLFFFVFFIWQFGRMFSVNNNNNAGMIGGATRSSAPKLLVNTTKDIPFIDATGHGSSQLFGSIAWDPYQTGGLGTPEHQRVTAGDVHRASLGILYIDEIKNLNQIEAITLLSVLEDGAIPITMRSQFHGGDTSAMAVSTEPVPSLCFLLAAGNFDSISQIHPALMDRIYGYGKVVRMNNDMPNNLFGRHKYIQFIAQESKRFHLPPFSKSACIEIINEGRRRSNKRDSLTTKFRPLISIIKTSGTLAQNKNIVYVTETEVKEAINEHCKTIQRQLLEHYIQEQGRFMEVEPKGSILGQIYGLAVSEDEYSGEMTGSILRVKAQLIKKKPKDKRRGYYSVTGIAKDSKWIKSSVDKVRSVILKKYNIDIAQDYFTHVDFSQAYNVDGPSAGVTMAILLCSLIEGKPIRQDVAVTGEINISSTDDIDITAIGGVHEKIKAAESWGFKKVIIPSKNLKYSIDPDEYSIKIVGCHTLDEYLKEILSGEDA